MTIREKLLLKLAQDPSFEGVDETEKALVAELKAEMAKSEPPGDADVKAAAKEMAAEMVKLVKELVTASQPAADPDRKAVKDDPKDLDIDAEIADATKRMSEDEAKKYRKSYRFSEFVKGLYNKDFGRVKSLAEGTDGQGGYLVPDEFRAELIEHIMQRDSIRRYATVIPMEGKLLEFPKVTADVKVYWGTENKSISTTSVDFGNVTLTPFRLNAIVYTSRELFEDSAIAITEILRRRFASRITDEENMVFIKGNGTTQPKGIDAETLRTVNCGGSLAPDDLNRAYWKLPEEYRNQATWLLNSRVMIQLENAKDTNGAYLYPSLQAEVKTLKGRPVFVNDYVASAKGFFGDLSYYLIGDRQQMTMEVTTEGASTWEKHQVGIKVIERVDGELGLTTSFVELSSTGVN